MIDQFIRGFTEKKIPDIVKIGREYYQLRADMKELMNKINRNINRQPVSAGLFLGEDKGKHFRPSMALLEMLGPMTERWVMIDENSEWLFTCGRDVFGKSVVKSNVSKGLAIVVNRSKEVLGYGMVAGSLENSNKIFLNNFLDRGDYLRREMGGRPKRAQ
jgi:ribosome biogenesis protein Nip4